MKLLFVSQMDAHSRAVQTISNYVKAGERLGHEVAVFGEELSQPSLPYSLDVQAFDCAIFVVHDAKDFPDLPYLAHLLDGMPKERRIVIDCCGRYNDTIRVEHDFNHLEKLDGHQGWEWIEGLTAISDTILQPTLSPLRDDVRPFLFHGYDPSAVARPLASVSEAVAGWSNGAKPYGAIYVGNNWQRWTQMAAFLEAIEPVQDRVGPICLVGWDWDKQPDWAVELGVRGAEVDTGLLERLGVETRWAIPFDEVVTQIGEARFSPVIHRPLFKQLGLVSNRTFETFCADTIPLLLLPHDQVKAIYGTDARALAPSAGELAERVEDMIGRPEPYWQAVLRTREHLAEHHSYERRFHELLSILDG